MENLSLQYPSWYLILCVLLGLIFSTAMYFKDDRFSESASWLKIALAFLRFLVVTGISILLLSPLLKTISTDQRDPIVVFAQDVSSSIGQTISEEEEKTYQVNRELLFEKIESKYELQKLSFGESVRFGIDSGYTDKLTNLSQLYSFIYDQYDGENLGAVIISSDGIYNEGSNPIYLKNQFTAPVHSIALGDTTIRKDLVIKQVFHNKIAYLGDKFSVQVDVIANNCMNGKGSIDVYEVNGQNQTKLDSKPFSINSNDYFGTSEFILDADVPGVKHFRIAASPISGETSRANNVKDIYVEVLDARQKILILANAPHPDLSALTMSISTNKNYEATVKYIDDSNLGLIEYDMVILHNLPSANSNLDFVLRELNQRKTPRMFMVGSQVNLPKFNQVQDVIRIIGNSKSTNESQAILNEDFSFFTIGSQLKNQISGFVPLTAPFGNYSIGPKTEVLMDQRIGKVDTKYPLIAFAEDNQVKTGVIAAEGIWRWRLFDYLENKDHNLFNELISKTIQYVSVKEDRRKFRVSTNDNIFRENENVLLQAELYNDSYEMINDPEVKLSIYNASNQEFKFTFSRNAKYYILDAGIFPPGQYRYKAETVFGGKPYEQSGRFSIRSIQLELFDQEAKHSLLRSLSDASKGQVFYPDDLEQLANLIVDEENLRPIVYQTSKTKSLINFKWLLGIIIFLLSLEWFLRRYNGSY